MPNVHLEWATGKTPRFPEERLVLAAMIAHGFHLAKTATESRFDNKEKADDE